MKICTPIFVHISGINYLNFKEYSVGEGGSHQGQPKVAMKFNVLYEL